MRTQSKINKYAYWEKHPAQFIMGVKRTYYNREARKAIKEAAKIYLPTMRLITPKDTGRLAKNLGIVVKTYRKSAATVAIIGSRRKRPVLLGTISKGPRKGKPLIDLPSRRFHFSDRRHSLISRTHAAGDSYFHQQSRILLREALLKYVPK